MNTSRNRNIKRHKCRHIIVHEDIIAPPLSKNAVSAF